MQLDDIGYHYQHVGEHFLIDRPIGMGDWLLLLVKSPAVFCIGSETIHTAGNAVIIYEPFFPQYYYTDAEIYCNDWLQFMPNDEEQKLISDIALPLNTLIEVPSVTDVSQLIRYMLSVVNTGGIYQQQMIDCSFRMILYKTAELASRRHEPMNGKTGSDFRFEERRLHYDDLLRIRQNIYRHPGREWTIRHMAESISLSESRFQHLYAEIFHTSVQKDRIRSRIEMAAKLLTETDMTLTEISGNVGYASVSYFSKQFHSYMGMPPEAYRKLKQGSSGEM